MNNRTQLAIAALCVIAAVLAAVLVFTWDADRSYADVSAADGDYIMFTGAAPGSADMLYVIDRGTQRMNAYQYQSQSNTITPVEQINLSTAFRNASN